MIGYWYRRAKSAARFRSSLARNSGKCVVQDRSSRSAWPAKSTKGGCRVRTPINCRGSRHAEFGQDVAAFSQCRRRSDAGSWFPLRRSNVQLVLCESSGIKPIPRFASRYQSAQLRIRTSPPSRSSRKESVAPDNWQVTAKFGSRAKVRSALSRDNVHAGVWSLGYRKNC